MHCSCPMNSARGTDKKKKGKTQDVDAGRGIQTFTYLIK